MKKFLIILCCLFIAINVIKLFIPSNIPSDISEIYNYCEKNGYNTEYCFLTDFSKPSGMKRFYIYSFKENKIIHKSLCAQGLGVNYNIFKSTYSNEIGSNYSSLGKYKVGNIRKMSNPFYGKGYTLYGLDSTNSNALVRGILIHHGNLEFETFPLPCLPVSKGCFGVSTSMMKHIEDIKKQSSKPILLYAYEPTSVLCSSYNGIDVSHYQGTIDWEKVAEDKQIQFVYLKATEGKNYVDKTYAYNLRQARKFGLKVGSYHYFRMTSSPKQQFENFKKTAPKEKQDLIPMIDVETSDKRSKAEVQKALKEFVKLLTDYYGVQPMFYGTMRSCNTWLAPEFNNYKYYVGRYGNKQPQINGKNGKYIIWQYSEKGTIKGIPKYVDLCRFAKGININDITLQK